MKKGLATLIAASCVAFAAAACSSGSGGSQQQPTAPGVPNVQSMATDEAVNRIAGAACDHEQQCNNIGTGKHYGTRDVCESDKRTAQKDNLRSQGCPGVNPTQLEKCVTDLRGQPCGVPVQSFSSGQACYSGNICMK